DLLETDGSWDVDTGDAGGDDVESAAIAEMGARIHARTEQKPAAIERALRHGLKERFLRFDVEDGRCTWTWTDEGPSMKHSGDVALLPPVHASGIGEVAASA